ncbi:MAG: hypothetical protein KDH96_10100 [Candidatus Riesia sp.]|nr:hypothetical protein [Candidatus Riesia sp.]
MITFDVVTSFRADLTKIVPVEYLSKITEKPAFSYCKGHERYDINCYFRDNKYGRINVTYYFIQCDNNNNVLSYPPLNICMTDFRRIKTGPVLYTDLYHTPKSSKSCAENTSKNKLNYIQNIYFSVLLIVFIVASSSIFVHVLYNYCIVE